MRGSIVRRGSPFVKLYLLPPIAKFLLALFVFLSICTTGYFFLKTQAQTELSKMKTRKEKLEKEVAEQAKTRGELLYYSKHTNTAQEQYVALLKQFPSESEVSDLLANITQLGTATGLKFISFKPQAEKNNKYYVTVPVDIVVQGHFHSAAKFLSDIANLPGSVVVVNKFSMTHADKQSAVIKLEFVATLYHTLPTSAEVKV